MKSPTLEDKIAARINDFDSTLTEFNSLLDIGTSRYRFDSSKDFAAHLAEGALLNVSVLASKALSVPCGEYMVWMTDAGHTMLVPTTQRTNPREVFEQSREQYEVMTRDLLTNWNRIERVLTETYGSNAGNLQQGGNEQNLEPPEGTEGDEDEGRAGEFRNTIDMTSVDRPTIANAMKDRGHTVTSLAAEVGVEPPAISRILRKPKDTQGDPGGRNPSMGLASEICSVLRIDPTAAFPDIFNPQSSYQPRNQPGNDGSGSNSRNKTVGEN